MSLKTRKNQAQPQAQAQAGRDLARQAVTRATPLVKSAGTTAAQSVQQAREWAAPRIDQGVYQARGWTAPRIDQAAQALQETVTPKISGVLVATARRIEPSTQAVKRRVWPRLITGLAIAAAAGGVIAAILRKRAAGVPDSVMADEEMAQADAEPEAAPSDEPVMTDTEVAGNGKRARH